MGKLELMTSVRCQLGFTLLEVLIVVAIMGAVAMAIPNFIGMKERVELKQAIVELQTNFNMARMVAINRNTTVPVTLAIVNSRVQVAFGNFMSSYAMPSSISAVAGTTALSFNSYGMLVGVAANVQTALTSRNGQVYSLQVTPGGRTKWCAGPTCT